MLRQLLTATFALLLAIPAFASTPVNVNKADASTIADSLDGIGLSKAKAIVAYREEHGPFKTAADLTQVKGIGQATIDRNSDAIQFSGGSAATKDDAAKPATAKAKKEKKQKKEKKPKASE